MSLCSSYRRISTHFLPLPPSIFKPLNPKPPSSFPISPKPHLSKSFTVRSTPTTKPSSPDPNLHHSNNQYLIFEQLPQNLQQIIKLFQSVQDPKAKYEQLLFYGKNLKPLEPQFKTDENKVKGCVSQVWLRAYFDDSNKKVVIFEADSDALITKGLAALLVQGLSGCSIEEIVKISPEFIVLLGLQQSLSPSRNNGFLNMFQLMQKKALMLFVEAEKGSVSRTENVESPKADSDSGSRTSDFELSNSSSTVDVSSSDGLVLGSRGQRIREILNKELQPVELELEDVSYQHAGHAGVKGSSNGETHFNLRVVSKEFEGKSMVKRHRLVYSLLDNELQSGLHALSIEAKTPAEVGR
ncbi:putative BolA protein [Helianthus annuus]|nr:putative BolA protein [Helianthus annuus]KAJ0601546.1 putative BolA protein [Helianthus annuus]KAJ0608629.1 putative BolA protein [Helianthus annuus]KAJ0768688.1 putative BolA protein [Helianthus annuus]KAJ0774432.1 putative BolA protein [Helianthus annuus]